MTDRVQGFTVALDEDIRIDDIEFIINAIKMVKGVNNVEPLVADPSDFITRSRLKSEVQKIMIKILDKL